jgi:hypothetical protein
LLLNLIPQDLDAGWGLAVLDSHDDFAETCCCTRRETGAT